MWVLLCTLIFLAWAATVHAGTSIVLVGDSPAGATNFLMDAINSCSTLGQQYPGTTCAYQQISATALSDAAIAANWDSVIQSTNGDIFFGLSFMYGGALATVGPKYPSKSFVLYDSPVNPPVANVIGLTFAEDQSGFLAGAAAGVFTTSKKVGVIGGLAIPPVKRFVNGYLNGILSVCSTCEVYRIYQPSFADAALGQAAAQYLISKGADVIFGAGGSMGSAGILYAAQQNTFVIGVDTDESLSTFAGQTSGQYLLASAMKYVGVAVKSAFTAIQAGNRGNYNMLLDASLST
ncbi:basic membrane lipoprotein [Blastocladiella britannica]|nr:basic membrane lipoprotein [Blastocladiella britannica]